MHPLSLKQITTELQTSLFDLGIKNIRSPIRKIVELVELFDMYDSLKLLDFEHWDLKTISLGIRKNEAKIGKMHVTIYE